MSNYRNCYSWGVQFSRIAQVGLLSVDMHRTAAFIFPMVSFLGGVLLVDVIFILLSSLSCTSTDLIKLHHYSPQPALRLRGMCFKARLHFCYSCVDPSVQWSSQHCPLWSEGSFHSQSLIAGCPPPHTIIQEQHKSSLMEHNRLC